MKKLLLTLSLFAAFKSVLAQISVSDFETFSLIPNSAYTSTNSTPFQTAGASFEYKWDPSFGGYWTGGFAYTNKYDSTTAGFSNLYGVKPLQGYSLTSTYVVGQDRGTIKIKAPFKMVEGFYLTNTTYAYKAIRNGNSFSRKFGDTTGTYSGTTIAQGSYPDYFKVTTKGYKNGLMKSDSVVFFLADFRFTNNMQDYVVNDWRWVNTTAIGDVDSLQFFMYSSDVGSFGINTPLFFGLDDFTVSTPNLVGLASQAVAEDISLYPNPFKNEITLHTQTGKNSVGVRLFDSQAKLISEHSFGEGDTVINLENLESGIYFMEIKTGNSVSLKRIVKL